MGYMNHARKKDTPPVFENDLGRVVCDFSLFLTGQRICSKDCSWTEKRYCYFGDEVGMDRAHDELLSVFTFGQQEDEVDDKELEE